MSTLQRTRIIIDVDAKFHKQVKLLALERDKTIKQLVTECLAYCISTNGSLLAQLPPAANGSTSAAS